jgi:hypothetical protein
VPATAICTLRSLSPLSFSKHYTVEKPAKESASDYEKRTWRERCHYNDAGNIQIPPMAFKKCVANAASFLGRKIPGRRNATYTKHFAAGLLVLEPLVLKIKKDDVKHEWLFLPSDGKPGGGSRVDKCFPLIPEWSGVVTFHILDGTITKDVFVEHLKEAGNFIGLCRFRPQKGGYYGRFTVENVEWVEDEGV